MQTYPLSAKSRETMGRKNYALRAEGNFPAVVYGEGVKEPKNVAIERRAFVRVFKAAGESGIVELSLDGKNVVNVLIQDVQTDPLRDEVIHADFRAIDMNKPIEVDVKITFVGESPAIKGLGGIFVHPFEALRVRALPKDLPHEISVDISGLKTFEDAIHLKDVAAPAGVEFVNDLNATIATVNAPRSEEELAELNKAVEVDVTKIEVEKKGKEEEEGAEGAAAAGAEAKADEKKPEAKK
jgi:large subunit ribosomal protein L25